MSSYVNDYDYDYEIVYLIDIQIQLQIKHISGGSKGSWTDRGERATIFIFSGGHKTYSMKINRKTVQ